MTREVDVVVTDDEIRAVYRRIKTVAAASDNPEDAANYHRIVMILSELSSIPYERVHQVCLEED